MSARGREVPGSRLVNPQIVQLWHPYHPHLCLRLRLNVSYLAGGTEPTSGRVAVAIDSNVVSSDVITRFIVLGQVSGTSDLFNLKETY